MKAAIFYGKEDIRIEDVEIPEIESNEVLIKVAYCGICGSDVTAFKTGNYVSGLIIGHEFSGIVEEVGVDVKRFRKGDRVTANGYIPCGRCKYCLSGKPSLCDDLQMTGITINGALAEYVKLPEHIVYKLPDQLSLLHATLVDPLSNVLHAVNLSGFKPGNSILIQGAGPIGLVTLEVLKRSGAGEIFITEISEKRKILAMELGADTVIDPTKENLPAIIEKETKGEGVDIVFDTTGAPSTLEANFTLVKKGGEIIVIGITEEPVMSDFFTLVVNELTIKGSYGGFNEYPKAIEWLANNHITANKIITSIISLEDLLEKGFKVLIGPAKEGKVVVKLAGGE
ncbi:MAG: alcohol dehydrogenase catalytic domain-containing protein [Thermoprotei archaeon]